MVSPQGREVRGFRSKLIPFVRLPIGQIGSLLRNLPQACQVTPVDGHPSVVSKQNLELLR